jgi:dUTP pyrophosphatase|tara:strand:- start:7253 stop:7741 length:489 start_codon:yes stop_codon:yes gene_type:complete
MILAHSEIKKLVEEKALLENHEEKNIGGAGVDLRVWKFYRIKSGAKLGVDERELPEIEEISEDWIEVQPSEYVLIETLEKVNMPSDIAAWMRHRSTLQRSGVGLLTALIDPGFKGTLTFGLRNFGAHSFKLQRGARVGQIIFSKVAGEGKDYDGRYQGGKVV